MDLARGLEIVHVSTIVVVTSRGYFMLVQYI
jgi:hypothetical protein